jgi:Tropinone reductase 1
MSRTFFIILILSIICFAQANNWKLPPKSTAVVTGGTKGIGYAIVSELGLTFGCKILTCARNESELNGCVEEWRSKGMDVRGCVADISTTEVSFLDFHLL